MKNLSNIYKGFFYCKKKRIYENILRDFIKKIDNLNFKKDINNTSIKDIENLDLFFRQKIIDYFFSFNFKEKLILSVKEKNAHFPLPGEVLQIINARTNNINFRISNLSFFYKNLKHIFIGLLFSFKIFLLSNKNSKINSNYIQIMNIFRDYHISNNKDEKYCVINWFAENKKNENFKLFAHKCFEAKNETNSKFIYINEKLLEFRDIKSRIHFISWSIYFFFKSILYLFLNKWHYAFFYVDIIVLKKMLLTKKNCMASEYYFSYHDKIRPLWTFDKNFKQIKFIAYNMSCSQDGIQYKKKYSPFEEMFVKNILWDNILEWSDVRIVHLKKMNSNLKLKKVKPIYSIDKKKFLLENKISLLKKVAVFDLPPLSDEFKFKSDLSLLHYEHLTFKNVKGFLDDIYKTALQNNFHVILKPRWNFLFNIKNKISYNFVSKKYIEYLSFLSKKENFTLVDAYTSSENIINNTDFNISYPFTSTGVLSTFYNKKSFYYFPNKLVKVNDIYNQGISTLNNINDLDMIFKDSQIKNHN